MKKWLKAKPKKATVTPPRTPVELTEEEPVGKALPHYAPAFTVDDTAAEVERLLSEADLSSTMLPTLAVKVQIANEQMAAQQLAAEQMLLAQQKRKRQEEELLLLLVA